MQVHRELQQNVLEQSHYQHPWQPDDYAGFEMEAVAVTQHIVRNAIEPIIGYSLMLLEEFGTHFRNCWLS